MSDEGGEGGHGDKPWVYFMVDSFFLVTQFFVVTFRVRSDEVSLPQRLPPGGGGGGKPQATRDEKQQVIVEVTSSPTAVGLRKAMEQKRAQLAAADADAAGPISNELKNMENQYQAVGDLYVLADGGGGQPKSQKELVDALVNLAKLKGGEKLSVRVRYQADVPFGDVLTIFNACNKAKIGECGLIPLRGQMLPGG